MRRRRCCHRRAVGRRTARQRRRPVRTPGCPGSRRRRAPADHERDRHGVVRPARWAPGRVRPAAFPSAQSPRSRGSGSSCASGAGRRSGSSRQLAKPTPSGQGDLELALAALRELPHVAVPLEGGDPPACQSPGAIEVDTRRRSPRRPASRSSASPSGPRCPGVLEVAAKRRRRVRRRVPRRRLIERRRRREARDHGCRTSGEWPRQAAGADAGAGSTDSAGLARTPPGAG